LKLIQYFRLNAPPWPTGPLSARRSETYRPSSSLSGLDLAKAAESSLGETLKGELGVTSTYNGPGASRPLIRGFGGDRVRVLEGGVGSGDVSGQGPDHAVGLEPLAAERIEVVRSPATLLYGSSAVGGVVNVLDKKIPREIPDAPLEGSLTTLGGTVADERTGALELNGRLGSSLAWHASGLRRATDDYGIPGYAKADHEEDEGGAHLEEEGLLPNSAVETSRGALGLSLVGPAGYLGFAISGMDKDYGVPGHGHEEGGAEEEGEHREEGVTIALEQRRFDLEGSWRFRSDLITGIEGRFGFADYLHTELEGEEVGTRFSNEQWEGRMEIQHALSESTTGAVGLQVGGRDFLAEGEEVYVPPSGELGLAAFLYEEIRTEGASFQLGARVEGRRVEQKVAKTDETDVGFSTSAGVNWEAAPGLGLALSLARSVKLPSLEELYSDGPHAATFAYEVGDPHLKTESAYTIDATLRLTEGTLRGELTAFTNLFQNFIYTARTGEEAEGLPILQFTQGDARFWGAEAAVEFDLIHRGQHHLMVEGWGDYVRARLTDLDQDLPRIPPLRLGTGIRYDGGVLRGDLGLTWVARQNRTAPLESESDGYALLDGSVGYRLFTGELVHDIVLQARNLTDQEARPHTSFLKELAPLPGREIRLMYRFYF